MLRDARSWYHLEFLIRCQSALQPERWRLFEVKLSIQDDPGKDIHDSSLSLCSAVALKLKCKVGVINEQLDFRLSYEHAVSELVDSKQHDKFRLRLKQSYTTYSTKQLCLHYFCCSLSKPDEVSFS